MDRRLRQFLLPSFNLRFFLRASLIALITYIFFGHILTPFLIRGSSMEPTYRNGSINFCLKLRYLFSKPKRFDVVTIRFAGNRWMLLKRVVALEGERVEFRKGKLFVNGKFIEESYVRYPCNWNLPPRPVERGHIYVVGDNRSMPIEEHVFGQARIERVIGSPLW